MKFDRIIWGVLLLFVGGVLLLQNFNVIDFYWRNIWDFWPIFLIILGVNILFNRNNSQTGNIVSLGILIVALSFLFVKGQEKPEGRFWWGGNDFKHRIEIDTDDEDGDKTYSSVNFSEPYLTEDAGKKTVLNLIAGGTSFNLKGTTDSLFTAQVRKSSNRFSLTKTTTDSLNTITLKSENRRGSWSSNSNDVNFMLNANPVWEMNVKMGAGEIDFDLANYKVRTLNFDGGAAELNVKVGSLLPIVDVNVKTGVADVKIKVPQNAGCRIKTRTGLSTKDFTGFTKVSEGLYETPNYQSATNKVFINFDGGLSNFEVDRY